MWYENCEIRAVYQRIPHIHSEYLIELIVRKPDSCILSFERIIIQSSQFYDELVALKELKVDRIYFTHGMEDIDFYRFDGKYVIDYSPNAETHEYYELSKDEFEKILQALSDK